MTSVDRPVLGIALMLVFCVTIPFSDAIAKHLGPALPLAVLLLARFAVQSFVLMPIVLVTGRRLRLGSRIYALTLLRAALQLAALGAMFASLRILPLADAIAIAFVMPFLLLLLGHLLLGETVGPARLSACAVGFCGTLLVVQPNVAAFGAAALLPLLVALFYAFFMLVTRSVARAADALTLQATAGGASLVLLAVLMAIGPDHPDLALALPGPGQMRLLVLMGLIGTVAHLAMTLALRFAPTATLAPMQYLELPFSAIIGWLFFAELPNRVAAAGIGLTIAAGLYVIHREHRASRALPALHPAPPAAG